MFGFACTRSCTCVCGQINRNKSIIIVKKSLGNKSKIKTYSWSRDPDTKVVISISSFVVVIDVVSVD